MKERITLGEGWLFSREAQNYKNPAEPMTDGSAVSIPHTWYRDEDYYRGDAIYQRTLTIENPSRSYYLEFYGVDKRCRIFLNGEEIGGHKGGYSTFAVELTGHVREGSNLLSVCVNNEQGDSISPISGDFTAFGGIYRPVELVSCDAVHYDYAYYGIDGIELNTELKDGEGIVHVRSHVVGADPKTQVVYTLLDDRGNEVGSTTLSAGEAGRFTIKDVHLWNGKQDAYLYQMRAELVVNRALVDVTTKNCGFRSYSFDADRGFFLNGTHQMLKGVAKHQDCAGCFSATTKKELDRDMELIEEIGANAIRLSHYQHPQYVYDQCDAMGFVVWAEIPFLKLNGNAALFENAKEQLRELILQNAHHPSIIMWGLQNEIAIYGEREEMYDCVKKLDALAKELDPFRVTTAANMNAVENDSPLNRITDIVAYNLYYGWYYGEMPEFADHLDDFHQKNPSVPLGISEYGADCNLAFHSTHPEVKDYTEEFTSLFHETVYPIFAAREFLWGSFVWNMFDFVAAQRDEGGIRHRNNKGLVSHDRMTRKDAFYYYKAIWSDQPFVQIAEKRFVNRTDAAMRLKVYSNCEEVRVSVNGELFTGKPENGICLFEVRLQEGRNEVLASAGELTDEAVFVLSDEADESYIWVDPNPGINVKNWFTDEVEAEKLFPSDAYSIKDTLNTLLESPEALAVIDELLPKVGQIIRDFIGTFSLEEALGFLKDLCDEETGKELNRRLTMIPKE